MPHATEPVLEIHADRPERDRLALLWARRGVLWSLCLREWQVRYRQALLGALWAWAQPLALTAAAALVLRGPAPAEAHGHGRALFVFTALWPWTCFQTALLRAVPSLVDGAQLVRKTWFPREALPLAGVLAVGLDVLLCAVLWLVWVALSGGAVGMALLFLPMLLAILLAFTAGCALVGAATNARFRDVKHALPVALQVGLLACPIFYASRALDAPWATLVGWTPPAIAMEGLRATALGGIAPDATRLVGGLLVSLAFLALSWRLYTRTDRRLADVL